MNGNHLVGLTRDDPVFAGLPSDVTLGLDDQTEADDQTDEEQTDEEQTDEEQTDEEEQTVDPPPRSSSSRLAAAVPLMLSASNSRQGFVRIVNEGDGSGSVRVFAVDDGGNAPNPFEFRLGA